MNEKSHVSLGQHVCLVCGVTFDSGEVLLDRRLKASMDPHTVTGWGLCPEHKKLHEEGYVALVEAKAPTGSTTLKPGEAQRTGNIAHVKREALNIDIGDRPMVFVEPGTIEKLQTMVEKGDDSEKV